MIVNKNPSVSFLFEIALLISATCLMAACNLQNTRLKGNVATDELSSIENMADQAYDIEDWKSAQRYYKRLTDIVPDRSEPWFRLGNAYAYLNRPIEALEAYRETLARDPGHAKAWHNIGIIQLRQATNTFIRMQEFLPPEHPVILSARHIVDAVLNLLQEDLSIISDMKQ